MQHLVQTGNYILKHSALNLFSEFEKQIFFCKCVSQILKADVSICKKKEENVFQEMKVLGICERISLYIVFQHIKKKV